MKKLEYFLKNNNVLKNEKIVVATSGGPDSMFLLNSLNTLGYTCICAHVNHNVREVSKDEYKFVENYCNINNIIFEGMKIEKYNKDNFHNEARTIRYNFFENIVKKHNAKYLATAHHGDDLVETILMRLSRGSNLNGYKGFNTFEQLKDYILIRPLVEYTKDEIKEKCQSNNIEFVTDLSNDSDKYTRNRYRHTVLDFLKQENKNVHEKYYDFSKELSEAYDLIEEISKNKLIEFYKNNELSLIEFKKEKIIIQKTILELILSIIYKDDINKLNKKHINDIINLINNNKPQLSIELPNNILVIKTYDKLTFKNNINKNDEYEYILEDKLELPNGTLEILSKDIDDTSNYTIRLNSEDLKLPLYVRNKKDGDKMIVKNMTNHKKVKDIFIENKISLHDRRIWPIVIDSEGKIIWIPGLKKSEFDIKKTNKYDIIIKYDLKER